MSVNDLEILANRVLAAASAGGGGSADVLVSKKASGVIDV